MPETIEKRRDMSMFIDKKQPTVEFTNQQENVPEQKGVPTVSTVNHDNDAVNEVFKELEKEYNKKDPLVVGQSGAENVPVAGPSEAEMRARSLRVLFNVGGKFLNIFIFLP